MRLVAWSKLKLLLAAFSVSGGCAFAYYGNVLRKKSDSSDKPFMSEWNFVYAFFSFFSSALRRSVRLRTTAATAAALSFLVSRFTQVSRQRLGFMFFASLWYIEYLLKVVEVPEVECKGTFFNRRIVSLMHRTLRRYYPCVWLANANFSTVGGALIRDTEFLLYSEMHYVTDTIKSYDGVNTFTMDWYQPENGPTERKDPLVGSDRPVVVIVHGLGGSSDEAYLKKIARGSHEHGWRCASFDYWRLDFAEFRDLDIALNRVRASNPFAPIALVGISAGTHICMRYLQIRGKASPVCCAVLQSSVFDLLNEYDKVRNAAEAGSTVKKGYKLFMDAAIARMATRHIRNDKRPEFDRDAIQRLIDKGTNADLLYDAVIYAQPTRSEWPLSGTLTTAMADFHERKRHHPDPECCYRKIDKGQRDGNGLRAMCQGNEKHYSGLAMPYISSVEVTTLMIHSRDDPVVGYSSIDWEACAANKNIITVKTNRGGHVGWLSGIIPIWNTWADDCTVDFIRAVLEVHSSTNFMLGVLSRLRLINKRSPASGHIGENITNPSVEQMARICSASDLQSVDLMPLQ